jgi:hypothetical protein
MIKILQIISFVLVTVLPVFSADGRNCIAFPENRSENSPENNPGYPSDEFTVRSSHAAQSGIIHHVRVGSRHPGKYFRESDNLFASALKRSIVNKESYGIASNQILTTVLRI